MFTKRNTLSFRVSNVVSFRMSWAKELAPNYSPFISPDLCKSKLFFRKQRINPASPLKDKQFARHISFRTKTLQRNFQRWRNIFLAKIQSANKSTSRRKFFEPQTALVPQNPFKLKGSRINFLYVWRIKSIRQSFDDFKVVKIVYSDNNPTKLFHFLHKKSAQPFLH